MSAKVIFDGRIIPNDWGEKNCLVRFGEQVRVFYYPVSCGVLGLKC